jgi:hypothetical integral membrane protein (TIGR02206 family)
MTRPADALHTFHAFTASHAVVLGVVALSTGIACALGVRWRGSAKLIRAERIAGAFMLLLWLASAVYWILPQNYTIAEALPIHMCDVTGLIAPLVLITHNRGLRALLYFWGLGLSSQAMITPVLEHGPAYLPFWLFWLTHASIIGTAIYDLVAHRYRPSFRDCLFAIGMCVIWVSVVLVIDLSLDVNYGYVGNVTPDRPTIIDHLGPWPIRVYKLAVAVLGLFVMMWLPFGVVSRWATRRTDLARTPSAGAAGR